MKSKKRTKRAYTKPVEDKSIKNYQVVDNSDPERPMISRKATQDKIDIDKKIRAMLKSGHYNHNQIAGMLRGVTLEKVKDVSRKITT